MAERTRIVFFVDILQRHFDGVSNTIHQLAERLPQDRIDAIFITTYPPDEFPFPVHQCPYKQFFLYKDYRIAFPGRMKNLKKLLDDFDPHLIHYTSPTLLGRYALRYGKSRGIPVSSTYHTHFHSYMEYYFGFFPLLEKLVCQIVRKLTRWFYENTTCTFVPSAPMKDFLMALGIAPEKISFFRRGVDTTLYNPKHQDGRWKESIGIPDKQVILFVSRLVKEKEIDTIIQVYRLFQLHKPDVAFVITGDGPFKSYMEKHMPEAVFTGKQTKDQLAKIYASSDVFIFPSTTETFGNVVLEALASGLPCVVADAGGPKGIIERSKGGFVVKSKDENAFFDKLNLLLEDRRAYEASREHALSYAAQENWEMICSNMVSELLQLAHAKVDE